MLEKVDLGSPPGLWWIFNENLPSTLLCIGESESESKYGEINKISRSPKTVKTASTLSEKNGTINESLSCSNFQTNHWVLPNSKPSGNSTVFRSDIQQKLWEKYTACLLELPFHSRSSYISSSVVLYIFHWEMVSWPYQQWLVSNSIRLALVDLLCVSVLIALLLKLSGNCSQFPFFNSYISI